MHTPHHRASVHSRLAWWWARWWSRASPLRGRGALAATTGGEGRACGGRRDLVPPPSKGSPRQPYRLVDSPTTKKVIPTPPLPTAEQLDPGAGGRASPWQVPYQAVRYLQGTWGNRRGRRWRGRRQPGQRRHGTAGSPSPEGEYAGAAAPNLHQKGAGRGLWGGGKSRGARVLVLGACRGGRLRRPLLRWGGGTRPACTQCCACYLTCLLLVQAPGEHLLARGPEAHVHLVPR